MAEHGKHKGPVSPAAQRRVSAKIAHLRDEGKSAKQAAGAAYGMERSGKLGPKGGYKPRKKGR